MQQYKALIFDLGRVVFEVSFDLAFSSWGQATGLERDVVRKRFRFDVTYDRFSENKISGEQYAAHISSLLEAPLSYEAFEKGWNSIYLDVFPLMNAILPKLKKNYRLVALTNTNPVHSKVWPEKYADVLKNFERVFASHEIGARKPERKAYEIVLNYLGISPAEVIFLDDTPENCLGARDIGMKAIVVTSSMQLTEALQKEGIII